MGSVCPKSSIVSNLKADGTWRSGESSGAFISLLTEQALLTSGSRLTIGSLCTREREREIGKREREMDGWVKIEITNNNHHKKQEMITNVMVKPGSDVKV